MIGNKIIKQGGTGQSFVVINCGKELSTFLHVDIINLYIYSVIILLNVDNLFETLA